MDLRQDKTYRELLGLQIYNLRTNCGLSQRALAAEIGTDDRQICRYESGADSPSALRLYQLSQVLRCSMGYFLKLVREHETRIKAQRRKESTDASAVSKEG